MQTYKEWANSSRRKGAAASRAKWLDQYVVPTIDRVSRKRQPVSEAEFTALRIRQDRDHQAEVAAREKVRRRVNKLERDTQRAHEIIGQPYPAGDVRRIAFDYDHTYEGPTIMEMMLDMNITVSALIDTVADLQSRTIKGRYQRAGAWVKRQVSL
jgi:hypothetical protein